MAGAQPRQYVPGRRNLFPAFGKAEQDQAPVTFSAERLHGGFGDYPGGAAGRTFVQPGVCGLGLPERAPELFRADLPSLLPAVDPVESNRHVAVCAAGYPTGKKVSSDLSSQYN